jgi:phosphatidylglycerol:prolipoprotein diacylglycerol transferase
LLTVGSFVVHSYGAVLVLAALAAVAWAAEPARSRLGMSAEQVAGAALAVLFAALLGARAAALALGTGSGRSAGFFQAGLAAGVAAAIASFRRYRLPLLPALDAVIPCVPLGAAVGRLGCWLAGCCYGRPASIPWSVVYSDPAAHALTGVPLGVPLHPAPLYALGGSALTFALLVALSRRQPPGGVVFFAFLLLEGLTRVGLEVFRGDAMRGALGPLSLGQLVGLGAAAAGAIGLARVRWA